MTVTEIIEVLPMILQYCVPGYLVLKFFQFLSSRKIHEHTIVASCVISFLLLCVCEMIGEEVPAENWANTVYGQVLLAVLIGAFFAMILALLLRCKPVEGVFVSLFGVSMDVDLMTNLLDGPDGANVVIHPKYADHYILGSYAGRDIKDGEQWIAIQYPQYFDKDGEKYYGFEDDPEAKYVCRLSDIEYMEIVK